MQFRFENRTLNAWIKNECKEKPILKGTNSGLNY